MFKLRFGTGLGVLLACLKVKVPVEYHQNSPPGNDSTESKSKDGGPIVRPLNFFEGLSFCPAAPDPLDHDRRQSRGRRPFRNR